MAPNSKAVEQAGLAGVRRKSNPQRLTSEEFFTTSTLVKKSFAELIHADDHERIAIIPSVSYGMATVAKNLARKPGIRSGQEIVVIFEEFPSDIYAWEEVCAEKGLKLQTVKPPESALERGKQWNEQILENITDNTCLVMIPHVHWTDGTLFNLPAIRQRTRDVGAWMVIDGSQSVGALPIDVQEIQPDALITAGYKYLMGPYGLGFGYFSETFDEGVPIEFNWINRLGSDKFGQLVNYQPHYRDKAWRYSMGEQSNFIMLPMLETALRQLLGWGVANIQQYCRQLISEIVAELPRLGYWVEHENYRSHHLVGVRLPENVPMDRLRKAFDERRVQVSIRSNSVRVSTNVWNDQEDMHALLEALASVR